MADHSNKTYEEVMINVMFKYNTYKPYRIIEQLNTVSCSVQCCAEFFYSGDITCLIQDHHAAQYY